MTKIAEKAILDGQKLHILETHDFSPILQQTEALRANGMTGWGENRHVATVPTALLAQWAREAGIKWSDKPAMREMLKRKLLSGEFSKLRVWEGTY